MKSKSPRHRTHTPIYRDYFTQTPASSSAGAVLTTETFTATRPIRITGWKVVVIIQGFTATAILGGGYIYGEITRSTAQGTSFILDQLVASVLTVTDVAGTEVVGLGGNAVGECEKHWTDIEADDLGLVLDYGESIRFISNLTQQVAGVLSAKINGIWFYEEIGG